MPQSLFARIRERTAAVCAVAEHVAIDDAAIAAQADTLDLATAKAPKHDPASHHLGQGPDTVHFFLVLDALNFGSGYFPHLDKLPGKSGYFTVATRLAARYRDRGPLSVAEMRDMAAPTTAALFGQRQDNPEAMALMALFAKALRDLGTLLDRRFTGSATRLVAKAGGKAGALCEILREMELFRDEQPYKGDLVPFYKRAQLLAADLAVAFDNQGPGYFADLDQLTVFADNLVPHVLRLDGILVLDAPLKDGIARGELLEKDSPMEVELRAATVQAVERLAAVLRERGRPVTPLELDFLLWNKGQAPRSKAVPRPRCRTWFY